MYRVIRSAIILFSASESRFTRFSHLLFEFDWRSSLLFDFLISLLYSFNRSARFWIPMICPIYSIFSLNPSAPTFIDSVLGSLMLVIFILIPSLASITHYIRFRLFTSNSVLDSSVFHFF